MGFLIGAPFLINRAMLSLDTSTGCSLGGEAMAIKATIMNILTGRPIQTMTFERMPKPWASFTLESGRLVTAERIDVGKPAPGKFIAPVDVWVTCQPD